MESDFLFQKHDTESIKQMLELHLPIYALDHVDWLSCDCLKISMFATTIALRVAKHIANNLKNLENFVSLRGHETEFDLFKKDIKTYKINLFEENFKNAGKKNKPILEKESNRACKDNCQNQSKL